eukprot:2227290-Rhodomonas_salina.1
MPAPVSVPCPAPAGHGQESIGRYGHSRAYRPTIHKQFRKKQLGSVLGTIEVPSRSQLSSKRDLDICQGQLLNQGCYDCPVFWNQLRDK